MHRHLRAVLVGLSCLAAIGCKKHPKPAPDPSIEELRVALMEAAFSAFTQVPGSRESTSPVGDEVPGPDAVSGPAEQVTTSESSNGNLASWSRYVKTLVANLAHPSPATASDTVQSPQDTPRPDSSDDHTRTALGSGAQNAEPTSRSAEHLTELVPDASRTPNADHLAPPNADHLAPPNADHLAPPNADHFAAAADVASMPSEPPRLPEFGAALTSSAAAIDTAATITDVKPVNTANQAEPTRSDSAALAEPSTDKTLLAEQAALHSAGTGLPGANAGKNGATGIGAGVGSTGIGAGNGHTGDGAGSGATGMSAGVGFTGIGAGSGFTGIGAGSGSTGIGAGSGSTGIGAGSGFTGIGAGSGFTGIGAGSGFTGIGADSGFTSASARDGSMLPAPSRADLARTKAASSGGTSDSPGAARQGRRGYIFMLTPWGPLLVAAATQE